ncbi:YgfZ/GcvT domain-containing protein [Pseudarthrobacter sp. J1763]|uniref:CAF17-like 4Fe-4S cluster assembly/insertion protein YgfZ n=1 Tax=Pseudarthrobacter sp. J1763 TaxID=3420445 RepID=UPI003D2C1BFB
MTYNSLLLSRPGAVAAGGVDAGVAAHYGEPLPEQRALAGGKAVADFSHRGVVSVSGPDRLSWLNTLSSQQLTGLKPGESSELLLLSIQGRIDYDARIIDDGETAWLIVETAEAQPLAAWLNSMKFMLRVEVSDVSEKWGVLASTHEVAEWDQLLRWQDPWPNVGPGGYAYSPIEQARHPGYERPWFEYLVPIEDLVNTVGERRLAGTMASEALRIAAWRPRLGVDTDEKSIPHELDLIRTAVHLAKGCYKGQETVARVHNLGHPPRRLVFLHLDGSHHTLPEAGSPIHVEGRAVGTVTSSALHYEMGPIALAMVKRSVDPSITLTVVDGEQNYDAAQEIIVAPDAGQVVGRQTGFIRGRHA